MELTIKNIEKLPEAERDEFEQFLKAAISPASADVETRNFIINFVNEDNSIDADEIYALDFFKEWRQSKMQSEQIDQQFDSNFLSIEPPTLDSESESPFQHEQGPDLLSEFGISTGDHQPEEERIRDELLFEGEDFSEIPAPNIKIDDRLFTEDASPEEPSEPEEELESAESEIDETSHPPEATRADIVDIVRSVVAEMRPEPGQYYGTGSPAASSDASVGNAATRLVGSAIGLAGSTLDLTGTAVNLANSGLKRSTSAVGSLGTAAVSNGSSLISSINKFRKSRGLLTSKERAELTGLPRSSNVVDIRSKLNAAITKQDKTSVERDIALIADKKLAGKRNTLVSIMKGVEDGYPNGRLSSLEIAPGITAGAALASVRSENPIESAMAKTILSNNGNVPDAASEMEFVTQEYQRLGDTLESLVSMAKESGWNEHDIAKQFVEPVQEWMDKRAHEDELLTNLSDVQEKSDSFEESPEQAEERRKQMEAMIEAIQKLINKLLGNGQNQSESQSSGRTISR